MFFSYFSVTAVFFAGVEHSTSIRAPTCNKPTIAEDAAATS
jgi:hypothetical protein